jgi:putative FmdB family regulatory protein
MPLYQFTCRQCQNRFEERRPFAQANDPAPCPACGSADTRRPLAAIGFISNGGSRASQSESISLPMSGGCGCGGACACGGH